MKLTTHFNDAHKDHQCCVECQIIVKGTKGLCCSKALKKHITTVHQTSNHKGQSKVLLCPHCGEAFQRKTTYEAHINQAWSLTHLTCLEIRFFSDFPRNLQILKWFSKFSNRILKIWNLQLNFFQNLSKSFQIFRRSINIWNWSKNNTNDVANINQKLPFFFFPSFDRNQLLT